MESSERHEGQDPQEAQREVDERIDELQREGAEMEDRLQEAGSDAEDVDVHGEDEAAGGGMGVSELVGTDDDGSQDEPDEE